MIESLCIENFLSIKKIELNNLSKIDIVCILGSYKDKKGYSNGTGKSSLSETIHFAVTGNHRYKTDFEVIRIGQDFTKVSMIHINKKNKLEITRILKKKVNSKATSSTVEVKLNKEIVASGTREGQQYINKYFSITPEDFKASYFFRQKEHDTLLKSGSSERIKFLQKFFKSYIFDDAKKKSAKERNIFSTELIQHEGRLYTLLEEQKDMSTESDLKSTVVKLKVSVEELKRSIQSLNKKNILIETKIKEEVNKNAKAIENKRKLQVVKDKIQDIEYEIEKGVVSKNKYLREIMFINKDINSKKLLIKTSVKEWSEKNQEKLDNKKDVVDKKTVDVQVNNAKIQLAVSALENLNFDICPTCGAKMSSEIKKAKTKFAKNIIKDLQESNIDLSNSITIEQRKIAEIKRVKQLQIKKWNDQQRIEIKIKTLSISLKGKQDFLDAYLTQIEEWKHKLDLVNISKTKIGELRVDKVILEKLNKEKKVINNKVSLYNLSIEEKISELSKKQTLLERVKKLKKKIAEVKRIQNELRRKVSDRAVLEDIFEKCKMEIISIGIEELEEHANNVMSEVGAVHKEIIFEKTKEGQKGNISDVIDIYLIDDKGKRMVNGLSGGEWDLTSFALRTSLARYKLLRMNSIIDFVILDEIFGALDDNSRVELANMIKLMKEEFAQIFVITHTELQSTFEYIIEVEMNEEGFTELKTEAIV